MVLEEPSYGQKRVSDELRQRGTFISPDGVRCVWLRHELEKILEAYERRFRSGEHQKLGKLNKKFHMILYQCCP